MLDTISWTPPSPGEGVLGNIPPHFIMAVAIKTTMGWKAYIGFALEAWSIEENAQHIAGTGAKLMRHQAAGMFPNLKAKDYVF